MVTFNALDIQGIPLRHCDNLFIIFFTVFVLLTSLLPQIPQALVAIGAAVSAVSSKLPGPGFESGHVAPMCKFLLGAQFPPTFHVYAGRC